MTAFSIDDVIGKITDILDNSADRAERNAEQYRQLGDLVNDSDLRQSAEGIVTSAIFLGGAVVQRVSEIFAKEEPEPEPEPEPEASVPQTFSNIEDLISSFFGDAYLRGERGTGPSAS